MNDIDVARELAAAGVPIFVAPPCTLSCGRRDHTPGEGHNGTGFHFPMAWQLTRADPKALDEWEPGAAVAMVCGHLFDALDVDPRNGGELGWLGLKNTGALPRTYGVASTPSGGEHHLILSLGIGKGIAARGVDLQAGAPDGEGRGFLFIAPTIKRSKVDHEMRPYHWVELPQIEAAREFVGIDDSGEMLRSRVLATRVPPAAAVTVADDPFPLTRQPEQARDGEWTEEQAKDVCRKQLTDLRSTRQGDGFNSALNSASMLMGHFVGEFWSMDRARGILRDCVTRSVNGWADTSSQDERTITSGLLAGSREPYRRVEKDAAALQAAIEEPAPDEVDAFIARLLTPAALGDLPNPVPLINGIMDLDTEVWLAGQPGSFKSFIALDWAGCVGAGIAWQGHATTQGLVAYIVAEGAHGMKLRVRAWEERYSQEMTGVLFLPSPVQVTDAKAWKLLIEGCKRLKVSMVVLDTQARMSAGLDENGPEGMGMILHATAKLREETGAAVVPVHHLTKTGESVRGHGSLIGAADTIVKLVRPPGRDGEDLQVEVHMDKQKDMEEGSPLTLRMRRHDWGVDHETGRTLSSLSVAEVDPFTSARPARKPDYEENLTPNQAETLQIMRDLAPDEGLTITDILRYLNERRRQLRPEGARTMAKSSLQRALTGFCEGGILFRIGARYALVDDV
jgi:hypothetical protein